MNERAEELARRFEVANDAFIREIEALSAAQWRAACAGEGWPVGVVAHHVGAGTETIVRHIRGFLADEPVEAEPVEAIRRRNAEHAARFAGCSQAETAAYLRETSAAAADLVRGLTEEQLARRGLLVVGFREMDVGWLARFLVGHLDEHRDSIRAALAG